MARQSTVAKLSRSALIALIAFCDTHNCGVILRIGGVEHGYTATELRALHDEWDSSYTHCVRKGWDSPERMGDSHIVRWLAGQFLRCIANGDVKGKHGLSWAYWAIGNAIPVTFPVNGRQVNDAWSLASDPLYRMVC
jgi:hypothetical protein